MTHVEKIYTGLCMLFCVLVVLGNLTYQKFVALPLPSLHTFELSVGALLYPITFLLTDLITEFYGPERARFCVRAAILMNMLVVLIILLMDSLEATPWSKVDTPTFHLVFGFYSVAFIGSMIACYAAQTVDVFLYAWIRKRTKGRYLWLRNNASTAMALLLDTTLVISIMTLGGALPQEQMGPLIAHSYAWKLGLTICSTPLFYLCVHMIRKFIQDKPQHRREGTA